MITISLDESGTFEHNSKPLGDVVMIAGIVYDDHDNEGELEEEKSRIKNFFKQICEKHDAVYPKALHCGSDQDDNVSLIKQEYKNALVEFFREGKYMGNPVRSANGKERDRTCGTYYVYALVKSRDGKKALRSENISNAANDDMTSNLYLHMSEDALSRLLFYNNVFIDHEKVSFDLATRVYMGEVDEDISAYQKMGHGSNNVPNGKRVYLTNSDVYRTALERDMLSETENDIDIDTLQARSIDYKNANSGHELLYMADAVCSYLEYGTAYKENRGYLRSVWDKMNRLTEDAPLMFVYDDVDTEFVRAWRQAESGDIYNALSIAFDAFHLGNEAAEFYESIWKKELCKRIEKKADAGSLDMAIRKYSQSTRTNNINQQKLIFIFEELERLANKIAFRSTQEKSVLYELYDAGISAYNHIGNPEKAKECSEKCREYARFVGIERELRNRNKIAVGLCDSFRFKEAEELIITSYEYYRTTYEAQKKLFGENSEFNKSEYGIVCSQLGQIYGYMLDPRSEEFLQKALQLMERETADYYITESYLLHYYLAVKNKEKYENYAEEYFGGNTDLQKQLEYLVREGSVTQNAIISLKFAMYVYLKSVYVFYMEEIPHELLVQLLNIEGTIERICEEGKKQMNGHPWELSYKYLAMIAFQSKHPEQAETYRKKMNSRVAAGGNTIEAIKLFGNLELDRLQMPGIYVDSTRDKLWEIIQTENPEIKLEQTFEAMEKVVTYTYR